MGGGGFGAAGRGAGARAATGCGTAAGRAAAGCGCGFTAAVRGGGGGFTTAALGVDTVASGFGWVWPGLGGIPVVVAGWAFPIGCFFSNAAAPAGATTPAGAAFGLAGVAGTALLPAFDFMHLLVVVAALPYRLRSCGQGSRLG